MKTDIKGISTCKKGEEHFEFFKSIINKKRLIQYEYRSNEGELFTCVAPTLEECRRKMHSWALKKIEGVIHG